MSVFINNFKDYYKILQIDRYAEYEVIAYAYKALAKKNHPDIGGNQLIMAEINEAYKILSDPGYRKIYDDIYDKNLTTRKKNIKSNISKGLTGKEYLIISMIILIIISIIL